MTAKHEMTWNPLNPPLRATIHRKFDGKPRPLPFILIAWGFREADVYYLDSNGAMWNGWDVKVERTL